MRKLIITEEEKKSILGLHGISEQNTPPVNVTPTNTTPTTTTLPPATGPKPMYGTPEQREAAKKKRLSQREKNFNISVSNAYGIGLNMPKLNIVTKISDSEFNNGCSLENNEEFKYLNGDTSEPPSVVYREMEDGFKVKIDMSKYFKYVRKQNKQPDVPLDGLMAPNFKPTSCGISKEAAKQDKKDWSKK
jgi:hypothetical protein